MLFLKKNKDCIRDSDQCFTNKQSPKDVICISIRLQGTHNSGDGRYLQHDKVLEHTLRHQTLATHMDVKQLLFPPHLLFFFICAQIDCLKMRTAEALSAE